MTAIQGSNWYLLPVELQLMHIRMLNMAQKPIVLQAGTIPVNMDTFVNVMWRFM